MTEWEKMISGRLYIASDPELVEKRNTAQRLLHRFQMLAPDDDVARTEILRDLFGTVGSNAYVTAPFHCDYGENIHVGDNFYANCGCVILDCAPVTIGSDVMLAPHVGIYAATHPLNRKLRTSGKEYALPITIKDGVWIGGGVTILPGVTIGEGSVIGAGSVVSKDIPANVLAVGNPCRVLRALGENEREGYVV